jgi:ubiquinone/menaquinone biosynthesis C-methylase UbiE
MVWIEAIDRGGWLIGSRNECVLVNPYLNAPEGSALRPVHAVLLTKECEGAFELASLDQISREVPVFVAAWSSQAAVRVLRQMGFKVERLDQAGGLEVGQLALTLLMEGTPSNEPFIGHILAVRDAYTGGSFHLQTRPHTSAAAIDALKKLCPDPGLWCYSLPPIEPLRVGSPVAARLRLTREILDDVARIEFAWGKPAAVLLSEDDPWGGTATSGDSQAIGRALAELSPELRGICWQRGDVITLEADRSVSHRPRFERPPGEPAGVPALAPARTLEELGPLSGSGAMRDAELAELADELADFARHLCGRPAWNVALTGAPVCLRLLIGEEPAWKRLSFVPVSCAFHLTTDQGPEPDGHALECWGPDLLAALRGRLSSTALLRKRARFRGTALTEADFLSYFHPLQSPSRLARRYEMLTAALTPTRPRVAAAEGSPRVSRRGDAPPGSSVADVGHSGPRAAAPEAAASAAPVSPVWSPFYDDMAQALPDERLVFMNYGYAGADSESFSWLNVVRDEDWTFRYSANLVRHALDGITTENRQVLDVGSGRGGACRYLARHAGASRIVGVDASLQNVLFAQRACGGSDGSGPEFVHAGAESLPFPDEAFDIVLNLESSHCYADVPRFLAEVRRVLKPGGYFSHADVFPPGDARRREHLLAETGFEICSAQNISRQVARSILHSSRDLHRLFIDMVNKTNADRVATLLHGITVSALYCCLSGQSEYHLWRTRRRPT